MKEPIFRDKSDVYDRQIMLQALSGLIEGLNLSDIEASKKTAIRSRLQQMFDEITAILDDKPSR